MSNISITKKWIFLFFGFLLMMYPNTVAKAGNGDHALQPYDRVLAEDDFTNGDQWDVVASNTTSGVTFENGAATIKGSGPCNRMGYKPSKINANDFLIQLDLTHNAGNANSNAKIAFKTVDQYEGDRLQVRFDFTRTTGNVFVERSSDNNGTGTKTWSESADFTFEQNATYSVDILVKGKNIKVYIGDGGTPVLDVTKEDIATMKSGYFAIAGQFLEQDFSIDNLKISTDEQQAGEKYNVTLKAATNGDDTNSAGGTLTANVTEGYHGDSVTLSAVPARGYVFDHYEVCKADGTAPDEPITVENNTFTLDSNIGNVIVVAHFVTRAAGKFELFYDDYISGAFDSSYIIKDEPSIQNGEVTFGVTGDYNSLLLDPDIFQLKTGEGYRISLDLRKGNGASGTMQLMFKGTGADIDGRYALSLDGTTASIVRISGNAQTTLKEADFTFETAKTHMELEVRGNSVAFYAGYRKVLSYEAADGWNGTSNAAGLVNLTKNAPVIFGNLLVERIPPDINVKVILEEDGGLTEDANYAYGAVSLSSYVAEQGDNVKLTVIEKAGYRLKEYRAEDPSLGIEITDNSFTVPAGITEDICILAVFEQVMQEGRDYYIDSKARDDKGEGTLDAPWKSFEPLKKAGVVISPGSHIYLKRGSVFAGQDFRFKGMGTKEKPIVVDAYGEGEELPRLDGNGIQSVVSLSNQEYVEIRNLEITNTHPNYNSDFGLNTSDNRNTVLRAISVTAKNFGTVSGIRIQDCYIHDINGHLGNKLNGGIYVQIGADSSNGRLIGVPTKYDDMLIEGCTFLRVDRSGIKAVISSWCTQYYENPTPINWYPSTNVVIRNNYMEKIGGDGITVRDTDGALVEHNLVKDSRYQNTGYNVAIWPFQAANTVIQYNEVSDTHGTEDGQGLDCDYASSNTLMQYNYSHNNEGGFMLIMGIYPHIGATVRYNVSQNDRDKAFEFARGVPKGTMIYNNTLYSQDKVGRGILYLSNTVGKDSLGVSDMYLFNNLFCYPEGQSFYGGADGNQLPGISKLYNNGYAGGISVPAEEGKAVTEADVASALKAAGSAPETNDSKTARNGFSEELNGYRLAENSPMIDAGITMEEAIEHFGNGNAVIEDNRNVSPRDLYEKARKYGSDQSINFIMGENFPEVTGADYRLDFFGNSNLDGAKPDIGAAEAVQHTHSGGEATCVAKAACEICGLAYGELNAENHTGETEIKNQKDPTVEEEGYTGDTYCKDCEKKIADGQSIDKINPDKKAQEIKASNMSKKFGDAPFKLGASANGGAALTYVSRNLAVAKVDASGQVTIVGAGTAAIEIHAKETEEYLEADLTIRVTVAKGDANLKLSTTSYSKEFGSKAFNLGAGAAAKIQYESDNTNVAKVSENGTVSITGCGKAVITVTAGDNNYNTVNKTVTVKVVPQKAKIKSVSNKKKGKLVVSWKKQKEADGYVVEYSTDKKFKKNVKKITIKKNGTTKATIKKPKKGKKYYVRVKAYKTIDGKKEFGGVSKSIAKKVK